MQVTMNERRAVKEAKSKVGILQALLADIRKLGASNAIRVSNRPDLGEGFPIFVVPHLTIYLFPYFCILLDAFLVLPRASSLFWFRRPTFQAASQGAVVREPLVTPRDQGDSVL